MPLRRRVALVAAAAVGVAVVLAALICYMVVRSQLRGQVDDSLRAQAVRVVPPRTRRS
jgi:two-component system sensor histidine kinase MprB